MIYHLIDTLKYQVMPHTSGSHTWIDFRDYNATDAHAVVKDMIDSDNFLRTVIKYHNPDKNKLFHVLYLCRGDKSFFLTDGVLNQFPTLDERLRFACQTAQWCLDNDKMTSDDIVWFLNHSGHFNLKNKTACESELLVSAYKGFGKTKCACGQLDTALSAKSRQIKNGNSITPDAKIIVVNDINEGNSIIKSFLLNDWMSMGFLVGTNVPVVLNSRFALNMNDDTLNLLGVKE